MTELEKIRKNALAKYKKYVEVELRRLNDGDSDVNGLDISELEPEPPIKDNFTEAELKELQWHFKNLKDITLLEIYCKINCIDSKKYPKIKGLWQN